MSSDLGQCVPTWGVEEMGCLLCDRVDHETVLQGTGSCSPFFHELTRVFLV